jgi:hypothetical protein
MRKILRSRVAAVSIGALVVVGLGAGGATAAGMIDSGDIRNNSVEQTDLARDSVGKSELKDNAVGPRYLTDGLLAQIAKGGEKGEPGKPGDPGISNLIVGSGYAGLGAHDYWEPHSYGETIETCPDGQYAIGGGYSQDASTGGDGKYDMGGRSDVQVTVSAPYFKGDYEPVDDAGNFRADQWVVRGYNNGDTRVDVRAWVVCANVAK